MGRRITKEMIMKSKVARPKRKFLSLFEIMMLVGLHMVTIGFSIWVLFGKVHG